MKQAALLVVFFSIICFTQCKKKETVIENNPFLTPTQVIAPAVPEPVKPAESLLDKMPNASTGWNVPPCRLIDEEYFRKIVDEQGSMALIPELGANAQTVTSCTYRWMKKDYQKIELANKNIRDAIAKKGGGTATVKPVVNVVSLSYTGRYNDAASAASAMNEIVVKDNLKPILSVGDIAAWNNATNQLVVQKANAIFYLIVEIDPAKNLDFAKTLAIDACKRM